MNPAPPTGRFDRTASLVLLFTLALILASTAQLVYRSALPTDGWSVYTTELDKPDWIYDRNLVGAHSLLEQGDDLLEVDGLSVKGTASNELLAPPKNWVIGQTLQMMVLRGQQEISFDIPVVHWTLAAWWGYNFADLESLVSFLGALILFTTGSITFYKRPTTPSAQALLVLCSAIFANNISASLPDGLSVQFNSLAFTTTAFFSYIIFGTGLAPSLLAFTLLFPRPKQIIERHPWLGLLPYGVGLIILVALMTGASGAFGWLGTMGMFIASILSLVHAGFTQRDAVSRAQLRWAIEGIVIGLSLALMTFPVAFGWVSNPILTELMGEGVSLGFTVIGISLAVAVLHYRLYDIDVIIRRTLVYSILTVILALVYYGGVTLLQSILFSITVEQSTVAIVISTLAIAALFNPLRFRIQNLIDHRFYRRKYDAERTLAAFSSNLREKVNLDDLSGQIVNLIQATLQPVQTSLWFMKNKRK